MGSYNVRKEQKVADKEKPIVRLGCYDEKQQNKKKKKENFKPFASVEWRTLMKVKEVKSNVTKDSF